MLFHKLFCISLLMFTASFGVTATTSRSTDEPSTKVSVRRVIFRSPVPFTPSDRQKLIVRLHEVGWKLFKEQDSVFAKETPEELVREAYQDKGYFLAVVSAELVPIPAGIHAMALVLHVDPGRPYHLLDVSWKGMTVFSESDLTKLIPVRPGGELFNRTKIAEGLEMARNLYGSQGYINFACVPTPQIDRQAGTVAFVIDIDEGGQFHFGELRVEGMREEDRKILLSAWDGLRGQPYTAKDADRFFNRFFRSPLPHITPKDYTVRDIDMNNHSVDYSLRFVPFLRYRVSRNSQLEAIESP